MKTCTKARTKSFISSDNLNTKAIHMHMDFLWWPRRTTSYLPTWDGQNDWDFFSSLPRGLDKLAMGPKQHHLYSKPEYINSQHASFYCNIHQSQHGSFHCNIHHNMLHFTARYTTTWFILLQYHNMLHFRPITACFILLQHAPFYCNINHNMILFTGTQCRIYSVADVALCYGPRAFRGPALLLRFFYKSKTQLNYLFYLRMVNHVNMIKKITNKESRVRKMASVLQLGLL